MKAIVYERSGGSDVLSLVDRPVPEPGPGEVRVKVAWSGVNPTDWKSRSGTGPGEGALQVPNQDGSGVVDAVGAGVDGARVGERVWIWEAAWQRHDGTAQEYLVLPARQAVALPDHASLELGASLGIPAMTAHRALTLGADGPERLAPGALAGRTVLVAGGAGAVGNAAIQLARWAGATVLTTVSSPEKAKLAQAAGAHHVVDYRASDAATEIRTLAPAGVDLVVEVAPTANLALDLAVLATNGTVAFYADGSGPELTLPVRESMIRNLRWLGVLVYTIPDAAKLDAVAAISEAVAAGALRGGEEAGLPWHVHPLAATADAHDAVQGGAVGKVLIEL
ncbi:NADPH:quinone reductase [Streptacidiphilus jiangxiensis]|uniref:NADPH:quinone reductase n=1 Tax=Streptacidiphilus jiangxiensis TaxID=235985 RepID=A0A1H7VGE3_STRJI|nr:NADPH:quinone reductase [Streptacidiphilus jiangxiensis]SEM08180.1 NADPH:quinone reductase [Streptacidiphilus jiangxiensis]